MRACVSVRKRLKKQYNIADVVSGTYSFQADGVVLNIRAVDTRTGVVTTSAQAYLPRTDYEHMITARQGVYHNGEYFYRKQSDVRIVDRPVPYEGTSNTVKIVKELTYLTLPVTQSSPSDCWGFFVSVSSLFIPVAVFLIGLCCGSNLAMLNH